MGIGNVLWADEGFGVRAVEHLHSTWELPANVRLVEGGTQGIYLLEHVQAASILVILDAIDYGLEPGSLIGRRAVEFLPEADRARALVPRRARSVDPTRRPDDARRRFVAAAPTSGGGQIAWWRQVALRRRRVWRLSARLGRAARRNRRFGGQSCPGVIPRVQRPRARASSSLATRCS